MNQHSTSSRCAKRSRRGVTILIVLVLIAITLAFSFAMMRTQTASSQVQQNYQRRAMAKQAAMAGISIGLRKMSQEDWAGVGVDVTGNLSNDVSYQVTFETGDPTLTPGHADEAEYPYRVTVTSTGTSTAPSDSSQQSSHTVRVVMQLVRRSMQPTPSAWSQVQPYTLYHWNAANNKTADFEIPTRIEGPVAIHNELELCTKYPSDGNGEAFAGAIDHVTIFATDFTADVLEDLRDGLLTLDDLIGDPIYEPRGSWRFEEPAGELVAEDDLDLRSGLYDGAIPGAVLENGNHVATFDGLNDQVFLGGFAVYSGKITILARLKIDAFNDKMQIVNCSSSSTNYWALSIEGNTRKLRMEVRPFFGNTLVLKSDPNVLSLNEWVDVAAVYEGDHLTLYVNAEKVAENQRVGYLAFSSSANTSIGLIAPGSGRARYLRDLRSRYQNGGPDLRPFDGPLTLDRSLLSPVTQSLLENDLGLEIEEMTLPSGPPVAHPGQITEYHLYPGGKIYPVEELEGSISDTEYGPDLVTNPLGLIVCTDELKIYDNVTISGTLLTYRNGNAGDIQILGDNVTLNAVDLPPLVGATEPRQLPVAIVNKKLEIKGNSSGSLNGLAISWHDFHFHTTNIDTDFQVNGKLIVSRIKLHEIDGWKNDTSWWNGRMSDFMQSIDLLSPADSWFPDWLATTHNLTPRPRFQARPTTNSVQYHWHDWSQPLFIAHPDDEGLRWELTDWRDNP